MDLTNLYFLILSNCWKRSVF